MSYLIFFFKQEQEQGQQDSYSFEIKSGKGTAGKTLALVVQNRDVGKLFSIEIAKDLIKTPTEIKYAKLRFAICQEDKVKILNTEKYIQHFLDESLDKLQKTDISKQTRRHHGFLGHAVLCQMASLKYRECELYLNPARFTMPKSFFELEAIISTIKHNLSQHLPDGFNDWEDEDFEYEDDEREDDE